MAPVSAPAPTAEERRAQERALGARLRAGDAEAFGALYERHAARLHRILCRLGASREGAEDILQEAWLRLATHARQLPEETDVGAWLYTVARNLLFDAARSDRRRAQRPVRPADPPAPDAEEARQVARAEVERLEAALASLPDPSREILVLVGVEGLSPAEAGALLRLSADATRQRLHRARAQLADALAAGSRRP
jgi:RNA polymerase sigma-70 factor (ECF subfamily)